MQAGKVGSVFRKSNIGPDRVNPSNIAYAISTSSSNVDVTAGTEAGPAWTATGPSSASKLYCSRSLSRSSAVKGFLGGFLSLPDSRPLPPLPARVL